MNDQLSVRTDNQNLSCPAPLIYEDLIKSCSQSKNCPASLQNFAEDCRSHCIEQVLNERLRSVKVDPDLLSLPRAIRLVEGDLLTKTPDAIRRPWNIYKPTPKTWVKWERGNFAREALSETLSDREKKWGVWHLTMNDLQDLHKKYLEKDLVMPSFLHFLYNVDLLGVVKRIFPLPGNLRGNGSTVSGFRAVISQDDKKALEDEILRAKNSGDTTFEMKAKKSRDLSYDVKVTYAKPNVAAIGLRNLIDEINTGVIAFKANRKNDESPSEFANRIQRKYVMIHPFHEGNGRMSRFIQDLILSEFKLPPVPGGLLQADVSTPLDRYQEKTRIAIDEIQRIKAECFNQFSISGCAKTKSSDKGAAISEHCLPIYSSDSKLKPEPPESCQYDTPSLLEAAKKAAAKVFSTLTPSKKMGEKNPSGLGKEIGKAFIESLAEPLSYNMQTYSWVIGKKEALSRKYLYTNSKIFKKVVLTDAGVDSMNAAGPGLYVSTNPFDSKTFSVSQLEKSKLNKITEDYRSTKDHNVYRTQLDSLLDRIRKGQLLSVVIKKGQPVLDMRRPEVIRALNRWKLSPEDVYSLNPNIVITGYSKDKTADTWMNIKLADRNAFDVKDVKVEDFNENHLVAFHHRKHLGHLEESDIRQSIAPTPFGNHVINAAVDKYRWRIHRAKLEWENGRSNLKPVFYDPFSDECFYKKAGQIKRAPSPVYCEERGSYDLPEAKNYDLRQIVAWSRSTTAFDPTLARIVEYHKELLDRDKEKWKAEAPLDKLFYDPIEDVCLKKESAWVIGEVTLNNCRNLKSEPNQTVSIQELAQAYREKDTTNDLYFLIENSRQDLNNKLSIWKQEPTRTGQFYDPFEDECFYKENGTPKLAILPTACKERKQWVDYLKGVGIELTPQVFNVF